MVGMADGIRRHEVIFGLWARRGCFDGFDDGEVVEGAEDVEDASGEEDAPVGEIHGAEGLEDAGG
jgi:hypothetical protein